MNHKLNGWWAALSISMLAFPAAAIEVGMVDTFATGSGGWGAGSAALLPPLVVPGGGPGGAADAFLQAGALGGSGPSSRLVLIAGAQWSGNYTTAGVNAITIDLINLGSTALDLRLWLLGASGATAFSSAAVLLPVGGTWVSASFSLAPGALTGASLATLAGVQELRLFHSALPAFPGGPIVATLGLDNVSAVPEPAALWLMVPGLAVVAASRRRKRHARCTARLLPTIQETAP